ncbi:EamA family transporter [Pseudogracilibacillus auburnensis]|uniref:DME family drug/metabolite transporter n=1 Tax=Pseudogracilibacillus auburnensis TaxID=1494959 RepID=A0A2V3W8V1_9BACI|nr:EamA family transporter [Pseudogracilibacillus auburnensis]MBO1001118.1 EamA family transporter [Pseudogracilibacillus auburnensis]PXW90552.1 DME family drug/metabolite transporter [Pseudogracilibacillus auburnensis]
MKGKFSYLWVLIAAMFWGTTGTAQVFAPESAHPISIGTIRLAVGGLSLLFIVLLVGKFNVKNWPMKEIVFAALCMAFYQPLFFSAVHITGVAIGTVVAIGSAPILSGFLEWIIQKKSPAKVWWYSTLLSIVGCFMLFINTESVTVHPFGIVLALGAGLSFACYTLVNRNLVSKHDTLSVVAVVFTLSAIFLSPFLLMYDFSWVMEMRGIVVSLHLGIVATGIAYILFSRGLVYLPSSTAVTLSLGEPLTATLLGVFLVGEYLSITSWIGILFLIFGIGLLILSSRKPKHRKADF